MFPNWCLDGSLVGCSTLAIVNAKATSHGMNVILCVSFTLG